ncbi:MAG: Asp23 family, cell envelope-related function [Thermoleophilaceae bacterium]|nr:Asp23 family, cell envelope-related function [Thermoleophilaceae bacterium]
MEGQASISTDILARYAADAAREAVGVRGVSESPLPGRRGVRVAADEGGVRVDLHLTVDWGASIPDLGRDVQRRVREYLLSMADVDPVAVDVTVDEIGPRA